MDETICTTFGALAAAEAALGRLTGARMPFAFAYRTSQITAAVAVELRHFHEAREKLVREHGIPRAPTEAERAAGAAAVVIQVVPGSPAWAAFVEHLGELAAVPVTLAGPPLELEALAAIPGLELAPADLLALGSLVSGGDSPAAATSPGEASRRAPEPLDHVADGW